jgi:multidrug efflux pump subunit AcrB
VSLISLGFRTGIVVGLSVPIVLGVVALVMLAAGWNLERVSLGSLIIALGLLVDDGIIAVEMMVVKMEEGWDRVKAAAYSYASTAMPRLTGALITTAAFMPIGFSKSTTGEYAGGIFWIVGTAVVFSWFVSGVITPYLAVKMLPDFKKHDHAADPVRQAVSTASCAAGSTSPSSALVGDRRHRGWRWGPRSTAAGSCPSSSSPTARVPSSSSSCGSRKAPRSRRRPSR